MTTSRSGHEKSWLKIGGPSSKAKYSWLTDSEPVPWGKGEKNPVKGSEIEPETVCIQAVGALMIYHVMWLRTFCIMGQRVAYSGEANWIREPKGNRVLIARLVSMSRPETGAIYPWPGWRLGKTNWRTEPGDVAKSWDELWIGVKG